MKTSFAAAVLATAAAIVDASKKPNILFVLTDDQDVEMRSLDYMPLVHKYLINEGTSFDKHYCTGMSRCIID
jgi:arylsulfatase A-like enzyme